jgi:chaperone required for assembly of F1-ATPase
VTKLPNAVKQAKEAAEIDRDTQQSNLDGHLRKIPQQERVVPYSDKLFREVAIEWLIVTDQVRNHSLISIRYVLKHL